MSKFVIYQYEVVEYAYRFELEADDRKAAISNFKRMVENGEIEFNLENAEPIGGELIDMEVESL